MEFILEILEILFFERICNAVGAVLRYVFWRKGRSFEEILGEDESNISIGVIFSCFLAGIFVCLYFTI